MVVVSKKLVLPKIGLAAGVNKEGDDIAAFESAGFGYIEIGTVTPFAQVATNPDIRVFKDSIINQLGFPSPGSFVVWKNLREQTHNDGFHIPIGLNLGINRYVPIDRAHQDFWHVLSIFSGTMVDYYVLNLSSPNTPGLTNLQQVKPLNELLSNLDGFKHPLFVKISPNLKTREINSIVDLCLIHNVQGIVATNSMPCFNGATSGRPLTLKSRDVVRLIRERSTDLTIIGVGGILDRDDAEKMFEAGADSIQLCSGWILRGKELMDELEGI